MFSWGNFFQIWIFANTLHLLRSTSMIITIYTRFSGVSAVLSTSDGFLYLSITFLCSGGRAKCLLCMYQSRSLYPLSSYQWIMSVLDKKFLPWDPSVQFLVVVALQINNSYLRFFGINVRNCLYNNDKVPILILASERGFSIVHCCNSSLREQKKSDHE